jgi:hypothetical protein
MFQDSIQMGLKEITWENMDGIDLAHGGIREVHLWTR